MCYNGQSTLDYLLTYTHNLTCLTDFNVHDFVEFSNHAPLSFSFKAKLVQNCSRSKSSSCTYYKWDDTFKTSFLNDISNGIETLKQNLLHEIDNHSNCDVLLSQFTDFLCKCGNKYFEKHSSKKDTNLENRNQSWFDNQCREKRASYRSALNFFNKYKIESARNELFKKRREYK